MTKVLIGSATLAQLVAFATVAHGLEVPDSPTPTKASVRALLAASGFTGEEIDVAAEAPGSTRQPITPDDVKGRKWVRINIGIQEGVAGGSDAVPIGCNGTVATVMRGVDVDVPAEYVEVLRNAQKMIYDRGPNSELINPRLTPIYPFSILAILD